MVGVYGVEDLASVEMDRLVVSNGVLPTVFHEEEAEVGLDKNPLGNGRLFDEKTLSFGRVEDDLHIVDLDLDVDVIGENPDERIALLFTEKLANRSARVLADVLAVRLNLEEVELARLGVGRAVEFLDDVRHERFVVDAECMVPFVDLAIDVDDVGVGRVVMSSFGLVSDLDGDDVEDEQVALLVFLNDLDRLHLIHYRKVFCGS